MSSAAEASALDEAVLAVDAMTCASCVAHVEKAARAVPGVMSSQVNLARGDARVRFNPLKTSASDIAAAISAAGYPAAPASPAGGAAVEHDRMQRRERHAARWLRRAIAGLLLWLPLEVAHWIMYAAGGHHAEPNRAITWISLVASTVAMIYIGGAFYKSAFSALRRATSNMDTLISMGATVAYGYSLVAFMGFLAGWWRQLPDLYFMESTGLLALISLGHWLEARARQAAGSAIRELLELAPTTALRLESPAPGGMLGDGGPLPAPAFHEVPVSELMVGDMVLIRPGDRIPVDGTVVDGRSSVQESLITGEPLPVTRRPGDSVIGGTISHDGRLIVRVTKIGRDTALAQIVKLVEAAQSSKPPVQKLADQISAVFVPAVLGIALLTAIAWFAWGKAHQWESAHTWSMLAKSVCSVLIIACPCSLGLAIPAALMVGTGQGAKRGILFRDIDALQAAERIDIVALDKTGTVTRGRPVVAGVVSQGGATIEEVMRFAASAEQYSEHPLGKAIVAHARTLGLALSEPESFASEPGVGVRATIGGQEILVGGYSLLGGDDPRDEASEIIGTRVYVAVNERGNSPEQDHASGEHRHGGEHFRYAREDHRAVRLIGVITLTDELKPDSATAIRALHRMNLRTVLLTGDNAAAARAIAAQIGIDDVRSDVKPAEKAAVIRSMQEPPEGHLKSQLSDSESQISNLKSQISDFKPSDFKSRLSDFKSQISDFKSRTLGFKSQISDFRLEISDSRRRVCMVGDGVNDAPALAAADLGIALGSGSDVAREAGGIVLLSDSLQDVPAAIRLSRATMRTIRQNLLLAFLYNVLAIPLAAFGLLNPLIAAAAMALSDVSVIGNALRLRRARIDGHQQSNIDRAGEPGVGSKHRPLPR